MNKREPDSQMLMRLLEGGLEPAGHDALMARIQASPELRREYEALQETHAGLQAVAAAWRDDVPRIDITGGVMRHASEYRAVETLLARYTDGELTEDELRRLEAAAAARPECAREYEAAKALKADLAQAAARTGNTNTPAVDLVDNVMRAARAHTAPPKVVPLRTRPKPAQTAQPPKRPPGWWTGAALAAAAAMLILGAYVLFSGLLDTEPRKSRTAQAPLPRQNGDGQDRQDAADAPEPDGTAFELAPVPPPIMMDTANLDTAEESDSQWRAAVNLKEALEARQAAVQSDADAIGNISRWASLTPEEARQLLAGGNLSASEAVALAEFLPPEEAAALLRDAVQQHPEDPFLRYALAKHTTDTTERLTQLAELARLDPQNALPYYMEAQTRFESGDYAGAMAALTDADTLGGAHPYSLNAARRHQEVLEAAGMQPEVAQMLAAMTAGSQEYNQINTLSEELIAYGTGLESNQQYEEAEAVYQSVDALGQQVQSSAVLANEELAGLNAQLEANLALEQLYQLLQDPDNLEVVQWTYHQIAESLNALSQYLLGYNELFANADAETASEISATVMSEGDTNLAVPPAAPAQ